MRARLVLVLAAATLLAGGAGAAPTARRSVSPIIGQWYWSSLPSPVLDVKWEPRGLHGPKSHEIYATVLQDFQLWAGGCMHRTGEQLFEVNQSSSYLWPSGFDGTGFALANASGDCTSRPVSKVTVTLTAYPNSSPPRYDLNIASEIGASNFHRELAPGERIVSGESWAEYVAPGQYRPVSGPLSFVVDAGGTFADLSGRWLRTLAGRATLKCSLWTAAKQRWAPHGTLTTTLDASRVATVPIKQPGKVSLVSAETDSAKGIAYRLTLQGTFTTWTRLQGTLRYLVYSPVSARTMPANLDSPGKRTLERCDSGTLALDSQHVPGSWQTIAGNRR